MRFEDLRESLEELQPLGKGWRGIVFRSRWQGLEVAVKVAREKEKEYAIRKEGEILQLLKGLEGFPQLLLAGEDFLLYRFIQGVPLERVCLNREELLHVYIKVLELLELLDRMGINKEELHRLEKNTLIGEGLKVYLIDFERGHKNVKKRHNLSQFLQLLVKEGLIELDRARELGRRYVRGEEVYHEVRRALLASI